jgi:hypothetical protein
MTCEATRQQLLNAERPDRPPPSLRGHLADCPSCRYWLQTLTDVESRVPYLPVPPSESAKERFLKQLREPPLVPESMRVVAPVLPFTPPKERGLRKLAVALTLAAAVVLFAVGLSVWPRHSATTAPVAAGPTLAETRTRMREIRDQRVAKAQTPREKVEILAEFADELLRTTRDPQQLPSDNSLRLVAQLYEETVCDQLLAQARAIPPGAQRSVLPRLAKELGRIESEFSRLAAAAPGSAVHLQKIAAAARDGDRELRQLASAASA